MTLKDLLSFSLPFNVFFSIVIPFKFRNFHLYGAQVTVNCVGLVCLGVIVISAKSSISTSIPPYACSITSMNFSSPPPLSDIIFCIINFTSDLRLSDLWSIGVKNSMSHYCRSGSS